MSTTGETPSNEVKRTSLFWHDHFEFATAAIECRKAISRIKQRVLDEPNVQFSQAYAEEANYLTSTVGLIPTDIAAYVPLLKDLRGTLDKR